MNKHKLKIKKPFELESGELLPELEIVYHTAGELSENRDNVVWACHALTGNSDVEDWWSGLFGEGKMYDSADSFVVCANVLGSSYGTTGTLSTNPATNEPYYLDFPVVTVRDMVRVHQLLFELLQITDIHTLIGGSIGCFQALEWAIMQPSQIKHLVLVAGSASVSPWAAGFNETQRMALLADSSFNERSEHAGREGLKAARAIAMLSYRTHYSYEKTQKEEAEYDFLDTKAASYQRYQGEKLTKRFHAHSYYRMTQAFDSHNVGRGRESVIDALSLVEAKTLIVGIDSDLLFPIAEQHFLAENIDRSQLKILHSHYGHDGFLVDMKQIEDFIEEFYFD